MKTKSIIIGAGIILLFFAGNSVLAQHGMKMAANQTAKMACVPDLTDEQESQITQLRTEFSAATKNLRADMQIKKAELDKLKIQDTPNRTNINAKIDEITALRTEMQKKRTKMHLDIRELLTDEQKAAFDRHKMHQGHQSMHRHAPCKQQMHGSKTHKTKHKNMPIDD